MKRIFGSKKTPYVPRAPLQRLSPPHRLQKQGDQENFALFCQDNKNVLHAQMDLEKKGGSKFILYTKDADLQGQKRCSWFLKVFDVNFKFLFDKVRGNTTEYDHLGRIYDTYHRTAKGRAGNVVKRLLGRPTNFQQKFRRKYRQHLGKLPCMEFPNCNLGKASLNALREKKALMRLMYDIHADPNIAGLKEYVNAIVIEVFLAEIDAFLLSFHATPHQLAGELKSLRKDYVCYMTQWFILNAMVGVFTEQQQPCTKYELFKMNHNEIMNHFKKSLSKDALLQNVANHPDLPARLRDVQAKVQTSKRSPYTQSVIAGPRLPILRRSSSSSSGSRSTFRSALPLGQATPSSDDSMSSYASALLGGSGGHGGYGGHGGHGGYDQQWDDALKQIGVNTPEDIHYTKEEKMQRDRIHYRLRHEQLTMQKLLQMRNTLQDPKKLRRFQGLQWHKRLTNEIRVLMQKVQQGKQKQQKAR